MKHSTTNWGRGRVALAGRLILALAALALSVGLRPTLALAAETTINITDADSLKNAFATANQTYGEYTFNIQADITPAANNMTLQSGSTVTIIGNGHTLNLSQSGALVSITNGTLNLETEESAATDSVITLSGSSSAAVRLSAYTPNIARLNMYGGVIKDNDTNGTAETGGVYCLCGIVAIHGGTFENNSGTQGGAIALQQGSVATWDGAVFKNNTCTGDEGGGAIGSHINTSGITISGGTFNGNKATNRGGAISASNGGRINIYGGTFTGNEALGDVNGMPGGGGAIASFMGPIAIAGNVTFTGNNAPNGLGGAILSLGGTLSLNSATESSISVSRYGGSLGQATITGNSAKVGGGIASMAFSDSTKYYHAPVSMFAGSLHNNTATIQAADIYANHTSVALVSADSMGATLASTSKPITGWFSDDSTRWSKDELTTDLSSSYKASAPISLIAAHGKTAKSVSYEYSGDVPVGAPAEPDSSDVEPGEEATVADAPTLTGYTFSGWTATGVTVENGKFTMPDADVTFTGSWTVNQYTVTFDTQGGSPVGAATVDYGSAVAAPADPTRDGYTFKGWTLDGEPYDFSKPVTGDITLVATWEKNADPGDPSGPSTPSGPTDPAGPATPANPADSGTIPTTPSSAAPTSPATPAAQAQPSPARPAGALPQLGDVALPVGALAALGSALLAGGALDRRRRTHKPRHMR